MIRHRIVYWVCLCVLEVEIPLSSQERDVMQRSLIVWFGLQFLVYIFWLYVLLYTFSNKFNPVWILT